mmetsp:Transcript_24146/g.48906  ORF Transcript_24146/g.48906 Transcript_24146/m.48906 type:complete len:364 (-) Transcript_24146:12-1103(-)
MHHREELGRRDVLIASATAASSCSEAEDDLSDFPSDYDSSAPVPARDGACEDYYDDAESGVSSVTHLPLDVVRSVRSLMLDHRPFPLSWALFASCLSAYCLWEEPFPTSAPVVLAAVLLGARYRAAFLSHEILRLECAARRIDGFERTAASAGGTAAAALEALEVLACSYAGIGGDHLATSGIMFRSYVAEVLVRIARDLGLKSRLHGELMVRERRRRACLGLASAVMILVVVLWWSWPLSMLIGLTAWDTLRNWKVMREADRVSWELYELAIDDADIAGGRRATKTKVANSGNMRDICASSGKSWVINPLFHKLRDKPPLSGTGVPRRARDGDDGSYSPSRTYTRSTRRRRKQGTNARVGVV